MQSFLKITAQEILADYPALDQLVLVLPNRRAGLFLAKHFGTLISKPLWMPQIKTIEDVFYGLAEQKPSDQLTLIFELYKVYCSLNPAPEPFDRFYYWGEMILKDFNDLDSFLVDAARLYHQLEEVKEIEKDLAYLTDSQIELIQQFWKSFEVKDRVQQDKFLRFWKQLRPLYERFRASLEASGHAYSGMLYRRVAERLHDLDRPAAKYVFIGFNAFSAAEEKLIKHFISHFGADIKWDVDAYYTEDPRQEAGLFFRQYRKDRVLGPTYPKVLGKRIGEKNALVKVHAVPLKVTQANLVGKLVEAIGQEEALEETVIILPEEQLLFPVLHVLPPVIDKINVTMGYPVKNAPAYSFLESLLELQRYVMVKDGKVLFYHKAVKGILSSNYFRSWNELFFSEQLQHIEATNQVYVSAESLATGGDLAQLVFEKVEVDGLFAYLKEVIKALADQLDLPELQQSYLYQCFKQLTRLDELFRQEAGLSIGLDFYIRLFKQVFR